MTWNNRELRCEKLSLRSESKFPIVYQHPIVTGFLGVVIAGALVLVGLVLCCGVASLLASLWSGALSVISVWRDPAINPSVQSNI